MYMHFTCTCIPHVHAKWLCTKVFLSTIKRSVKQGSIITPTANLSRKLPHTAWNTADTGTVLFREWTLWDMYVHLYIILCTHPIHIYMYIESQRFPLTPKFGYMHICTAYSVSDNVGFSSAGWSNSERKLLPSNTTNSTSFKKGYIVVHVFSPPVPQTYIYMY